VLSVAIITLAVGANLVVFTVVNALWLRPRPVERPDRVAMVMADTSSSGSAEHFFFAEFGLQREVRESGAFTTVAGQVMTTGSNEQWQSRLSIEAVGHEIETIGVTSEYFRVLGLTIRGRDFTRSDDRYGAEPVAIISDRLWDMVFHRRADAIGAVWPAVPMAVRIIGIAPPGFEGARLGEQADLWLPRNLLARVSSIPVLPGGRPAVPEDSAPLLAIGRLEPSLTLPQAQRRLDDHLRETLPAMKTPLAVVSLSEVYGAPNQRTILINEGRVMGVVVAAAFLVLVGGCATLMALVLVHYERRRSEFAVRLAMGASSGRLTRQLAVELAGLVAVGGVAALLWSTWSLWTLPALDLPGGISLGRLDLRPDWRVVIVGLAASAATVAFAACLPLVRFTRTSLARDLVGQTATASHGSMRLRQTMLGIHVASTVVVLVSAALFVRTIQQGFGVAAGFDPDRTLFVSAQNDALANEEQVALARLPRDQDFQKAIERVRETFDPRHAALGRQAIEALSQTPGIEAVAIGPPLLGPDPFANAIAPKAMEIDGVRRNMRVGWTVADPAYLHALDARLLQGRLLDAADADPALPVRAAVISASLASQLWPDGSAIGRTIALGFNTAATRYEIVGIVADLAVGSIRLDPPVALFTTGDRFATARRLNLVVRLESAAVSPERVRQAVSRTFGADTRVSVTTGRELIASDLGRERLGAWFFSGFSLVALVLGVGGIFGLVAYLAEARRREFAVRLAVGASPTALVRTAVGAGFIPTVAGIVIGLIQSTWVGQLAQSLVHGIRLLDPVSYTLGALLMLGAAGGAGLAAGWRVRRIDASEALRSQ
jgi:putative ABC transport system permease protein